MVATLKRMPPPLLVAAVGCIAVTLWWAARIWIFRSWEYDTQDAFAEGSSFGFALLAIVGLVQLGRSLTGRARTGARIAMWATAASLASVYARYALRVHLASSQRELEGCAMYALDLAHTTSVVGLAVGLGLAARSRCWIAIGGSIAFAANPPWFLADLYEAWLQPDLLHLQIAELLVHGVNIFVLAALACRAADDKGNASPLDARLRICRIALYGLAFPTALLAVVNAGKYNQLLLLTDATTFVCVVILALALLATGTTLSSWIATLSATMSLAVAGGMLSRITTRVFWPHYLAWGWPSIAATQLLTAIGVGALLVALAIAARRRGLEDLRANVLVCTGWFVALALGSITAQRLIDTYVTPWGLEPAAIAAAHVALIASWLVAATTVGRAARELGGGALPSAKLIRSRA